MIYISTIESRLGPLVAGSTSDSICLLEFSDPERLNAQKTALQRWFNGPVIAEKQPIITELEQELDQYFTGERREFSLPLEYPGTEFQQKVWGALLQIPYGDTRSYEEIAYQIGAPKAVRAVGAANGSNRLAILIPCHRVINKDGKLGGYGGGLWRKQWLLALEQRSV